MRCGWKICTFRKNIPVECQRNGNLHCNKSYGKLDEIHTNIIIMSTEKPITDELGEKANLAEITKINKDARAKMLNKMINHLNTIDEDNTVTTEERQKARDFLVQIRRLDLDHDSKLDQVAKETQVDLKWFKDDLKRFDEFESAKVVEWGDKSKVDTAFAELTNQYPSYTKTQLMIMAQKGLDLGDDGSGNLAPRYDSVIGKKLTAAAEDPKVYIDRYLAYIKDPGTATWESEESTSEEETNNEGKEELSKWKWKIDMWSVEPKDGTEEEKLKTLQDMKIINEKNEPIGYFKSIMALPSSFVDTALTYDQLALLNTNFDGSLFSFGGSFEEWAGVSTENETEDIVVMKDGHAVTLHDNPGNMPTFVVDGTHLVDNYRFASMSAFIDFVRKWGAIKDTEKWQEIALEKFADRLDGGKDGPVANYMIEKGYIDKNGDINNQFNSLMSLPGDAWGDYKMTIWDIQRFEDSGNYEEAEEFSPLGNEGTGLGMNLLAARFTWENGKVVCDELENESFDNVEKMMQHLKKVEDTMPENYDLKEVKDFSKLKPEKIQKALEAQAVVFKDRMPISGLIYEVQDDKSIVISRNDTNRKTTITREGNTFAVTVKGKKYDFTSFEQAMAIGNLINFTDKFLTTQAIDSAKWAIAPFYKDWANWIEYNRDWDLDVTFLDNWDAGANYYHSNINWGVDAIIPLLNDVYNEKVLALRSK